MLALSEAVPGSSGPSGLLDAPPPSCSCARQHAGCCGPGRGAAWWCQWLWLRPHAPAARGRLAAAAAWGRAAALLLQAARGCCTLEAWRNIGRRHWLGCAGTPSVSRECVAFKAHANAAMAASGGAATAAGQQPQQAQLPAAGTACTLPYPDKFHAAQKFVQLGLPGGAACVAMRAVVHAQLGWPLGACCAPSAAHARARHRAPAARPLQAPRTSARRSPLHCTPWPSRWAGVRDGACCHPPATGQARPALPCAHPACCCHACRPMKAQ